jgi:hypothetical protein
MGYQTDETPLGVQTVVLTCEVLAAAKTCSNTHTAPITAGHYLMVRIRRYRLRAGA